MSFTKTRNWDTGTDGDAPVQSKRFANANCVVLDGPNGEYFGWEDDDGNLFAGTILTENTAAAAARTALATELSNKAAEETARLSTFAALKAKREAGTDLDTADLNALADLFLGVALT